MYIFLIVIHVMASIFLIAVILLQAGRGGGLADTLGGSQMQSLFGTKTTTILTKLTTISAIVFICTCLSLAILSSRQSKSIVEKSIIPKQAAPSSKSSDVKKQGAVTTGEKQESVKGKSE